MAVLLVRHAKAGDRDRWEEPDEVRPLTAKGHAQAAALVTRFDRFAVERILSSPYLRCTQTVAPLAAARGLAVELSDHLAEGRGVAAVALVRGLLALHDDILLCTHGDIVYDVLHGLGLPTGVPMQKGSAWVLEAGPAGPGERAPVKARYREPPPV